jgi:hypothetical protein
VDKLVIVGQPFSPTSWRNQPLADTAAIAPNSATLVGDLQRQIATYHTWVNTDAWSTPIYTVPADQPDVKVSTSNTGLQPQMNAVPLPSNAQPAGPPDQVGKPPADHSLALWQPETDSYWDFLGLSKDLLGNWTTGYGGRLLSLSSNGAQFPAPWGASATGIPLLAGLQRIKELQRGVIDHAVNVVIPEPKASSCTWPANRNDGVYQSASAIPEGTRFRLPATLNLDSYNITPYAKIVGRAIQRYGMIVTDKDPGSAVTFIAEDPTPTGSDPYTTGIFGGVGKDHLFDNFPWGQLEALDSPAGC